MSTEETTEEVVSAPEADEHTPTLNKVQLNNRKRIDTLMQQAKKIANRSGIRMLSFYESHNTPLGVASSCDPTFVRGVVMYLAMSANEDFNSAVRSLHEMVGSEPQQVTDEEPAGPQGDQGQPDGDAGVRETP